MRTAPVEVAVQRFLEAPTEPHKYALKIMLEAYDCAANHEIPRQGCKFCDDPELAEIPQALKA